MQGLRRAQIGGRVRADPTGPSQLLSLELTGTGCDATGLTGLPAQLRGTRWDSLGRAGRSVQTAQIYEGTNQIQRMVIAKKLGL